VVQFDLLLVFLESALSLEGNTKENGTMHGCFSTAKFHLVASNVGRRLKPQRLQ